MISNNFLVFLFSSLHISFYFTFLWIFLSLSKIFFSLFLSSFHQFLYLSPFISPVFDFSLYLILLTYFHLPPTNTSLHHFSSLSLNISLSLSLIFLACSCLPPTNPSTYLSFPWFLFLPYFFVSFLPLPQCLCFSPFLNYLPHFSLISLVSSPLPSSNLSSYLFISRSLNLSLFQKSSTFRLTFFSLTFT